MLLRTLGVLVASFLAACAASGPVAVDRPQADARAAVAELVRGYGNPPNEAFFERVDSSRFPAFEKFRDTVREFETANREIALDVIVDGVDSSPSAPALGVRAHWNKSWVDARGMHKLADGRCEFAFRRQPAGGLLLTGVRGASPF